MATRRTRYPRTAAEEHAQRVQQEQERPFSATHTYSPIGWDQFDPRGVPEGGEPIASGSQVELMQHATKGLHRGMPRTAKEMFNVVRDPEGRRQHVSKKSLTDLQSRQMPETDVRQDLPKEDPPEGAELTQGYPGKLRGPSPRRSTETPYPSGGYYEG